VPAAGRGLEIGGHTRWRHAEFVGESRRVFLGAPVPFARAQGAGYGAPPPTGTNVNVASTGTEPAGFFIICVGDIAGDGQTNILTVTRRGTRHKRRRRQPDRRITLLVRSPRAPPTTAPVMAPTGPPTYPASALPMKSPTTKPTNAPTATIAIGRIRVPRFLR
jgi:hypothetical protein